MREIRTPEVKFLSEGRLWTQVCDATMFFSVLIFVGFWFVIQFLNSIGSLGVLTAETEGLAYGAPIGGFLVGLLLALIFKPFLGAPGVSRAV